MVSEIPGGLGWNRTVKRKATSQELNKISSAPGCPASTSFLVVWAAAVIWPQEFRPKPAGVGIFGHSITGFLISLAWLHA